MFKVLLFGLIKRGGGRRGEAFEIFLKLTGLTRFMTGLRSGFGFRRRKDVKGFGLRPVKKLGRVVDGFKEVDDPLV